MARSHEQQAYLLERYEGHRVVERVGPLTRADMRTQAKAWHKAHGCKGLVHGPGKCRFPFRDCDGGVSYAVTKI